MIESKLRPNGEFKFKLWIYGFYVIEAPKEMLRYSFSKGERADRVRWEMVSHYQTLSEDFILDFADRVNWKEISYYQTLSEEFIREFADRVH